jgi:hypothetical protein
MLVTISTLAERRIVRFPPWEGVGRGFIALPIPLKWRINPSLPKHNRAAPLPREEIKESSEHQQLRNNHSRDTCPHGSL